MAHPSSSVSARSMSPRRVDTALEPLLATPVTSGVLTLGPFALAVGQLLNSYLNGFSPMVAVAFAVVMIAFSAVATSHHAARYRLDRLEADLRS